MYNVNLSEIIAMNPPLYNENILIKISLISFDKWRREIIRLLVKRMEGQRVGLLA
jgi:hypothetical protein